jgi:hypothetical protein
MGQSRYAGTIQAREARVQCAGSHELGAKRRLSKQTAFQCSRRAGSGIFCAAFAAAEFSLRVESMDLMLEA